MVPRALCSTAHWHTLPLGQGTTPVRKYEPGKGTDSAMNAASTSTATPTAVITVPIGILTALARAIGGWTAAVYPAR